MKSIFSWRRVIKMYQAFFSPSLFKRKTESRNCSLNWKVALVFYSLQLLVQNLYILCRVVRKHFPYSWNNTNEKKRTIVKNIPGNRLLKIPDKGNQRVKRGLESRWFCYKSVNTVFTRLNAADGCKITNSSYTQSEECSICSRILRQNGTCAILGNRL